MTYLNKIKFPTFLLLGATAHNNHAISQGKQITSRIELV